MVGAGKSAANAEQQDWLHQNGSKTGQEARADVAEWFAGRNGFDGAWAGTGGLLLPA